MRKMGLGRGLDALLPDTDSSDGGIRSACPGTGNTAGPGKGRSSA